MLPSSALQIDDFESKNGELLPLSSSAFRCSDLERSRLPLDGETTQDEINNYYSSTSTKRNGIWGFFFDSVENDDVYKPVFDEQGKLLRGDREFSLLRGNSITDGILTGAVPSSLSSTIEFQDEIKSRDMLVKLCMEKSDIIEVIMKSSSRFSDDTLRHFTQALIESLQNAISNVTSAYTEVANHNNDNVPHGTHTTTDPARTLTNTQFSLVGKNELNAVLALEYLSKLVIINQNRTSSVIWPLVHECLCSVFDEKIDTLTIQTPFLAERFVVIILRAAICQCNAPSQPSSSFSNNQISAWSSLRLLRGVHSESISNISLRLSAGLYHLLHAIINGRSQIDLEQWYLLFSLLSAATTTLEGQQYVFDGLNKLIESNYIFDVNFTPCRHLLMRFLHRAFPTNEGMMSEVDRSYTPRNKGQSQAGKDATSSSSVNRGHLQSVNPWEGLALACLLRLTLMALGGYTNAIATPSVDGKFLTTPNTRSAASVKSTCTQNKYITFPLPVEGNIDGKQFTYAESSYSSSSFLSSASSLASSSADVISSPPTADILKKNVTQITVACVGFSKLEEVELLWTEASKIFSDVIGNEPLSTSRQAIFLLQTSLMSGSIVKLPMECWIKCIDEMQTRLPLNVKSMYKKFVVANSENTLEDICDISLRCCNILFEVMVSQFRQLLNCKEFSAQWLKFMTVLGTNISSVNKNLHIHDETIEMIGALLRLMRPLPVAAVANTIDDHVANTSTSVMATTTTNDASPNQRMGAMNLPETVSFESFEEDTLLRESWKVLTQINSNIPTLLSNKHPKIVADMTLLTKSPIPKPSSREKIESGGDGDHVSNCVDGHGRSDDGDTVDVDGNKSEKRGSGLFSVLFG